MTKPTLSDIDWVPPPESPRGRAARGRLEGEGFTIEVVDSAHWLVEGFAFWPELGMWRNPQGLLGPAGVSSLIGALKQARQPAAAASGTQPKT